MKLRTLLLGALVAIAALAPQTKGDDWNLFAKAPRTYADGEGPTAGLPAIERAEWNLFCPLVYVGSELQATEDWNFLAAKPVEQQDGRPVMQCLIADEFECPGCKWWQARGDKDLPVQLKFVVDNSVGDELGRDGHPKGWPVFRFRDRTGRKWDIFRVETEGYLINTWRRLEPGGQN